MIGLVLFKDFGLIFDIRSKRLLVSTRKSSMWGIFSKLKFVNLANLPWRT